MAALTLRADARKLHLFAGSHLDMATATSRTDKTKALHGEAQSTVSASSGSQARMTSTGNFPPRRASICVAVAPGIHSLTTSAARTSRTFNKPRWGAAAAASPPRSRFYVVIFERQEPGPA